MIPTGKFNKLTGEPIMKAEAKDVKWEKEWDEMDDSEKVVFLSLCDIPFSNANLDRRSADFLFSPHRSFILSVA